jgi:hypothetical protein
MNKSSMICIGFLSCLQISCATTDGPALGDSATLSPGWARLKQRLVQTVRQPEFWAPLAAAAVLQIDDQDERLSDRLREDTPLFGSTRRALDASDDLRDLTKLSYVSTAIAAPVNNNASWIGTKSKLLFGEWAGVKTTSAITGRLKKTTDRERPDGSNNRSLPSGHTSAATAQAQFAIINTEYLPLHDNTKTAMKIGFNSLAIGTAWARVEAGKHHPSDVLAGWALGYFIAEMAGAFIEGDDLQSGISAQISAEAWQIVYRQSF